MIIYVRIRCIQLARFLLLSVYETLSMTIFPFAIMSTGTHTHEHCMEKWMNQTATTTKHLIARWKHKHTKWEKCIVLWGPSSYTFMRYMPWHSTSTSNYSHTKYTQHDMIFHLFSVVCVICSQTKHFFLLTLCIISKFNVFALAFTVVAISLNELCKIYGGQYYK